jgi:diguanylate cyclase (GGDEF)-like protein
VGLEENLGAASGEVGLVVVDVDGFKAVNDAMGHGTGDEVLVSVAGALRAVEPEALMMGRTGGDEFVAVAPVEDEAGLRSWGEALRGKFREAIADLGVEATLSMGGLVSPASTVRVAWRLACERADELMYEAKRAGGDRLVISTIDTDG